MGQTAMPCKSTQPREFRDVGPQSLSRLESAVEFRLGKKALASFKISLARRSTFFSRFKAFIRSRASLVTPSRSPVSISSLRTHSCSVLGIQPNLGAIDSMAASQRCVVSIMQLPQSAHPCEAAWPAGLSEVVRQTLLSLTDRKSQQFSRKQVLRIGGPESLADFRYPSPDHSMTPFFFDSRVLRLKNSGFEVLNSMQKSVETFLNLMAYFVLFLSVLGLTRISLYR
jgi:hypothetical protein